MELSRLPKKEKKLRILLLAHATLVPPDHVSPADSAKAEWRTEYELLKTLRGLGHEVQAVGLGDDLSILDPCEAQLQPHIVFNLMEEFDGVGFFDQNIVSYFELRKIRYTGCNPRGLMLARDKALAKKILAFHGIRTPPFEVYRRKAPFHRPRAHGLQFPLIVKSVNEEASLGLSQASVVADVAALEERIRFLHGRMHTDALAENYIEGRELYVGILGNLRPQTLPVWELQLDGLPSPRSRIATRRVKWDENYRKRHRIVSGPAQGLEDRVAARADQIARAAYQALGLTGYARMDLRLTPDGELYLLEANPNPHIGADEDFAQSAQSAGVPYPELVSRILQLGLRWEPVR